MKTLFKLPSLYFQSISAANFAKQHGCIGYEFNVYGRSLGKKLLVRGIKEGAYLLLNPVSIVRYFEFEFVSRCINYNNLCSSLDVSSPFLFGIYLAHRNKNVNLEMINPDKADIEFTAQIVKTLGISNVKLLNNYVDVISHSEYREKYDHVWSISVIEHISGDYDDSSAVEIMYRALKPGGRLILTVPVDRAFWNEYREVNTYQLQVEERNQSYFFQRYYDQASIYNRILSPINATPDVVEWFGETSSGHFTAYEKEWMSEGLSRTVNDPRDIVNNYRRYASWEAMPGKGVCGLMITKPL